MARGLCLLARGAGVVWRLAAALALLAALLVGALATPGGAAAATTLTFVYTGAAQTWVVPIGVTSATVTAYGAYGSYLGGLGGMARATLALTPGETVTIVVGGAGGNQDGTSGSGQPGSGSAGAAGDAVAPQVGVPAVGGGGGGGGYYGGAGGGQGQGGGGGSGYGPAGVVFETGVRAGNGLVTVEFVDPATRTVARGTARYGDATATLTATVTRDGQPVPAGGAVTFTFDGQTYPATTNAQGVAAAMVPLPPGTAAGTYPGRVQASYAGAAGYDPSSGSGPLVVGRKILWVKPTGRTVGLRQANPPTTPPAGCVAQQTPTSACWLELANGAAFVNGDDWADLNLGALRFSYNRNPPYTNATEYVGKTYRITAFGAASANYDIRYQFGTLTVVAAP